MSARAIDMEGVKLGRLQVVRRIANNAAGEARWLCACECGKQTEVTGSTLRRKKSPTRSCGCLVVENVTKSRTVHGHSAGGTMTPTYQSWCAMWNRVNATKGKNFRSYRARGITICDRWKSYQTFLSDMGERPLGLTLDRVDNNGNYEPGNCRWATASQQNTNKRRSSAEVAA